MVISQILFTPPPPNAMKNTFIKKLKKIIIYTYLILTAVSLFLIAFAISFSAFKFYDENDLPKISLSSLSTARRTISRVIPKPYVVYSGSMEPTIKTASLIFTLPLESYGQGDIITFQKKGSKNTVTHRIEAVTYENGINDPVFYTRGDANEDIDQGTVSRDNVVGKVFLIVPYIGHIVDFAKTPQGFILLVIVPSTIIVYEELKSLFESIKGGLKKKTKVNDDTDNIKLSNKKTTTKLPKLSVVIPVAGVFLVFLGLSVSFFYDKEESVNNILGVGTYGEDITPTPTPEEPLPSPTPTPEATSPGRVVINEVYYDPDAEHIQPAGADENDFEWVELFNAGGTTVNIKDWKITDNSGSDKTISASEKNLEPGEYAVLARAANVFNKWTIPDTALEIPLGQNFGNGLANGGDIVILKDSSGNVVDRVSYGDDTSAFDPSVGDVPEGHSIERNPHGFDTDTASDFVELEIPSPGE